MATDAADSETGGDRQPSCAGSMWYEQSYVLQMTDQYGGVDTSVTARLKKIYAEWLKAEIVQESLEKKAVRTFRRKEMAQKAAISRRN